MAYKPSDKSSPFEKPEDKSLPMMSKGKPKKKMGVPKGMMKRKRG